MAEVAEGARASAALTAGCGVASSSPPVTAERLVGSAGTVVNTTVRAFTSVERAPVIKRSALGVVPAVVVDCIVVMPIEPPMTPSPSKTAEEADSKADSEEEERTVIPNSGIGVPPRPSDDRASVNDPRIIGGDINDFGAGRLDLDNEPCGRYSLLRRGLEIASFLSPPPARHPSHPAPGCSRHRREMRSRRGFCPCFQGRMEKQPVP